MTRHHALAALLLGSLLALLHAPPAAAAPPLDGPQTVQLSGVCPWSESESKEVSTALLGGQMLSPYFLYDSKGAWTQAKLFPYEVLASGEGLKSRHLLPGEYTRPGRVPDETVTCQFAGSTPDGAISLEVVGTVLRTGPPPSAHR